MLTWSSVQNKRTDCLSYEKPQLWKQKKLHVYEQQWQCNKYSAWKIDIILSFQQVAAAQHIT